MKQRIITAVVAVALFLPVLYFSHTVVWEIVMGLFAIIG
ncbi:MAG TPA: phosphatidate cytidylyltransferase, partial [Clostridiales bacterium]|nr:phosphatidate cytidylyltransferase [Clostridiales bacterium]